MCETVNEKIARLRKDKNVLSNMYLSDNEGFDVITSFNTVIFKKKEHNFYRLFFISIDEVELIELLNSINEKKCIINYPTKVNIQNVSDVLKKAKFDVVGEYERFTHHNVKYKNVEIQYASINQLEAVEKMLFNNFSIFLDHLPSRDELIRMIKENRILVNTIGDELKGLFIYTFYSKRCYFNCWYDESDNGLSLLFQMYGLMHLRNITSTYFWVRKDNVGVQNIHKLMGAKKDNIIDYVFKK
jgi:hypothetical protein